MKIRYKFGIGFTIIFFISFIIINIGINEIFRNYISNVIKNEMQSDYKSMYRYCNNYSQYKFIELNSNNFLNYIPKISTSICDERSCDLYAFNEEISLDYKYNLKDKAIKYDEERFNKSIKVAKDNKWTMEIYSNKDEVSASIAFPYYYEEEYVATIVLVKDYTEMYSSLFHIINYVKIFNIVLFIIILLSTYILSKKIVAPLNKLRSSFKKVEEGDYSDDEYRYPKDEIGELAIGYNSMKNKILEQIDSIKSEKEKVIQLERTRTDFFNNVTHELKTPLTTISGYAQIIKEEDFIKNDFGRNAIDRINKESIRMNKMIVSILDISKNNGIRENDKALINLKELLEDIFSDLYLKGLKYNLTFRKNIDDILIKCSTDEIRTIFINLIDNAIKYSLTNSIIEVESKIKNENYIFKVSNKSKEISETGLKNIFQPFYRENKEVSRELGSNGLGLFICSEIVNKYIGMINFEYVVDTVFVTVALPIKKNINDNILEI